MEKRHINHWIGAILKFALVLTIMASSCKSDPIDQMIDGEPLPTPILPEKTNTMKVYMHYMPWFESKEYSGYWGIHWRMANKNPDVILGDRRQIASHYYPLIGPYDSQDPDVVEYHLLLMKYAGIDGVLIDWYGSHKVQDYGANLENSEALINALDTIGLGYAIVYEEYTTENVSIRKGITDIEAAQADVQYMIDNYYPSDRYIKFEERPLLMTFGPRHFQKPSLWSEIFSITESLPFFIPLWHHGHLVGESGGGEFAWVDFKTGLPEITTFYEAATAGEVTMGSAYPGFHDYYKEGGWGESYGYVSLEGGTNFKNTLAKAKEYNLEYLQLVTWNDFGEGTMIEPTAEFGFSFLEEIQRFTGVTYTVAELELVHQLYLKRKELKDDPDAQIVLNEVHKLLNELKPTEADQLLSTL